MIFLQYVRRVKLSEDADHTVSDLDLSSYSHYLMSIFATGDKLVGSNSDSQSFSALGHLQLF